MSNYSETLKAFELKTIESKILLEKQNQLLNQIEESLASHLDSEKIANKDVLTTVVSSLTHPLGAISMIPQYILPSFFQILTTILQWEENESLNNDKDTSELSSLESANDLYDNPVAISEVFGKYSLYQEEFQRFEVVIERTKKTFASLLRLVSHSEVLTDYKSMVSHINGQCASNVINPSSPSRNIYHQNFSSLTKLNSHSIPLLYYLSDHLMIKTACNTLDSVTGLNSKHSLDSFDSHIDFESIILDGASLSTIFFSNNGIAQLHTLVRSGFNVNSYLSITNNELTPLHIACGAISGSVYEISPRTAYLISSSHLLLEPISKSKLCNSNNLIVQYLIDSEADVNAIAKGSGKTPLMMAMAVGHLDAIKILLGNSKIDPFRQDNNGHTFAFYVADKPALLHSFQDTIFNGRENLIREVNRDFLLCEVARWSGNLYAILYYLEELLIDPYASDENGLIPLDYAVKTNDTSMIQALKRNMAIRSASYEGNSKISPFLDTSFMRELSGRISSYKECEGELPSSSNYAEDKMRINGQNHFKKSSYKKNHSPSINSNEDPILGEKSEARLINTKGSRNGVDTEIGRRFECDSSMTTYPINFSVGVNVDTSENNNEFLFLSRTRSSYDSKCYRFFLKLRSYIQNSAFFSKSFLLGCLFPLLPFFLCCLLSTFVFENDSIIYILGCLYGFFIFTTLSHRFSFNIIERENEMRPKSTSWSGKYVAIPLISLLTYKYVVRGLITGFLIFQFFILEYGMIHSFKSQSNTLTTEMKWLVFVISLGIFMFLIFTYHRLCSSDAGRWSSSSSQRSWMYSTVLRRGPYSILKRFQASSSVLFSPYDWVLMVRKPIRCQFSLPLHSYILRYDSYKLWLNNAVGGGNMHQYLLMCFLFCIWEVLILFFFKGIIEVCIVSTSTSPSYWSYVLDNVFHISLTSYWFLCFYPLLISLLSLIQISLILIREGRNLTKFDIEYPEYTGWCYLLGKEIYSAYDNGARYSQIWHFLTLKRSQLLSINFTLPILSELHKKRCSDFVHTLSLNLATHINPESISSIPDEKNSIEPEHLTPAGAKDSAQKNNSCSIEHIFKQMLPNLPVSLQKETLAVKEMVQQMMTLETTHGITVPSEFSDPEQRLRMEKNAVKIFTQLQILLKQMPPENAEKNR